MYIDLWLSLARKMDIHSLWNLAATFNIDCYEVIAFLFLFLVIIAIDKILAIDF